MKTDVKENSKRKYPVGCFEILGELGRGGTGTVYLVRSKESGRRYAMKILKPDLFEAASAEARADGAGDVSGNTSGDAREGADADAGTGFGAVAAELLRAEAETMEELNGVLPFAPGIPEYYGEVYRGGRFAGLLMEYVEGESLQKLLDDGRVFSVREAAEMGVQLCGILARLHEMEPPRIYRDLKPGNVLVKGDGSCVLVDFGAVRAYRKGALQDTHPLGTEGYAAPEQYGGWEQSDSRTDVYGVGAVLHHMLTGRTPPETGLRPLTELLAGEGAARAGQYSRVDKILLRACSIAPSMRYPSCRELEKALERLCREESEMPYGRNRRLIFGKRVAGESAWRRFVMLAFSGNLKKT